MENFGINNNEFFENASFMENNKVEVLSKKLKKAKRKNIILTVFLVIFIVLFIGIFSVIYLAFVGLKPHFRALFGKNFNIASVSQISKHDQIDLEKFATKLAFIDDAVNILYHYDNKDNKKIEDAMFAGYLSALGDKYAEYMPAKEFEEFTETTTEGVYYGIGCQVTFDRKTKDSIVELVYEDSPADKAGIKKDDIFVSVNGEYVRGKDLEYIISLIRGEEGAKRDIEMYRKSEDKNVKLTAYCGKVDIKLVSTEVYEGNIGYLKLAEFTGKSASQFKAGLEKLFSQNIKGLIIDLRGNPGGELLTVCEIIDYMVKDNDGRYTLNQKEEVFDEGKTLLVYIKERDEIVDAAYAADNHEVDLPIVILTDYSTASAAELFTQTMRDYKKAKIVGVRTYGKGVVQNIIPYEDGSAIKFTVSEYFPPSGYAIDFKGILPDYSLDYDGFEINYDDDNNIIVIENNVKYVYSKDGGLIEETPLSTASEIKKDEQEKPHKENLKIYDEDNKFIDEDWYVNLNDNYSDKQLLQAIVVLKDKLAE